MYFSLQFLFLQSPCSHPSWWPSCDHGVVLHNMWYMEYIIWTWPWWTSALMQTQKYLLSSLLGLVAEMHSPCPQGICSLIGVPTWNIPVNQTNKHRQKAQQVVKMRDKLVATSKVKAGSPGRQESSWFQKDKRQYPHSIWGVSRALFFFTCYLMWVS